jgi:ABC-type antimicrobial peptide transport system permease subunit
VIVTIVADDPPREIVGVVGDTAASRWDRTAAPALYVPQQQESLRSRVPYGQSRVNSMFVLRINQPLSAIVPAVRRAVAEIDASLPVSQVEMVDEYLARQVEASRHSMLLVAIFGAIALLLAVLGIYAVVAYGVVQRRHEIGIRMALGARSGGVLGLVLRRSVALTLAGIVLGLSGATLLTRYLANLLFDLKPLDAATFAVVSMLFVAIAALASYVPARRATKIDPLTVLRYE